MANEPDKERKALDLMNKDSRSKNKLYAILQTKALKGFY